MLPPLAGLHQSMTPSCTGFDIFCRVVDNYGDIGVCWRLARQLEQLNPGATIRLWVDNLQAFARIEPTINPALREQTKRGVTITLWAENALDATPQDVVIEAFACDLPQQFIARMIRRDSLCINLEYLSAEKWVEGCHGLPSPGQHGLRKYFFFPGFTAATGGLLREPDLLKARDSWLAQPESRWRLLKEIGMRRPLIDGLRSGWRQVYLFCYPSAPADDLIRALGVQDTPTVLIVPSGVYPSLCDKSAGKVHVFEAPFVSQEDFDHLLWCSDLNFVRGEDSLVRAIWAGRPFVWQIYPQEHDAHLAKLSAWLELSRFSAPVTQLLRAWNSATPTLALRELRAALTSAVMDEWRERAAYWCEELSSRRDLAQSLVDFCAKNRRKE